MTSDRRDDPVSRMMRSTASALVQRLVAHGVEDVFGRLVATSWRASGDSNPTELPGCSDLA
jgi:hypothetical protein